MSKFIPDLDCLESRELLSTIKASIQPTSTNSALISWLPVRGIKAYIIQEAFQAFKTVRHHKVAYTKWVNIAVTKQTSINIGNLLPLHSYTFDIVAKNRPALKSPKLNVVMPAPNPGPLTLSATPNGTTSIRLQWTSSPNATNYGVYNWQNGQWIRILNTTSLSAVINGLAPNTTYAFAILAENSYGTAWSNVTSAKTAIPAPSNFTLTATTGGPTSINLSWTSSSYASYYGVYIYNSGQWVLLNNTTSTSSSISSLSQSTTYRFAILAHNDSGMTWSNEASATTSSNLPTIHTTHPTSSDLWTYTLGPDSLWSTNPVWSDVHQHEIGDCWLEASMAEVAYRTPNVIEAMFTDLGYYNEDGTTVHVWNVRLYDNSYNAHYITVDNEFPVNAEYTWIGNGDENGNIWACLIEKAYIIAAQAGWTTVSGVANGSYESLNSGVASWALRAITGHYASQSSFTHNSITDSTAITNLFNNDYYIVILTTTPVNSHIASTHYYSVQFIVPGSPNSSYNTFTIDNPWNMADGQYYGSVFTCNGTFLSQNWSYYDTCWF